MNKSKVIYKILKYYFNLFAIHFTVKINFTKTVLQIKNSLNGQNAFI